MNNTKLIGIKDVDLIAIEEIKKITKEYQINNKTFLVVKSFPDIFKFSIISTSLVFLLLTKFLSGLSSFIIIFSIMLSFFFILYQLKPIDSYINFYFKELEERKTKITDKAIFESFLYRFVSYKIHKESFNLNATSKYYLKKEKTNELTEEEIFISVIVFPEKYDLEKEDLGDGGDD